MRVAHHGSIGIIDEPFRPMTHFGTFRSALTRALWQADRKGGCPVFIQEARIDIRSPMRIEDIGRHSVIKMIDHLHYDHRPGRQRWSGRCRDAIFSALADGHEDEAFARIARENGYDGFEYENEHEDPGSLSCIIIESAQVKAAESSISMGFDEGMALLRSYASRASA